MNNLKSILKHSFRLLLIVVLSTFATDVASAKTINGSMTFLDSNTLTYFENIYERENYKNYVLASEYVNVGSYNYTNYYYLCLTNDNVDSTDTMNINVSCDKLFLSYRLNNTQNLSLLSDDNLNVIDSVYYSKTQKFINEKLLVSLNIGLFSFFLSYFLIKLFKG